ncbi:MAG: NAD(P)/FAD-dependent oxidoreductase [Coraliomargaritaceae bacterium]
MKEIAVIGGGAAGFFTAITAAETDASPRISIFEQGRQFLKKVRISGGGRCNVTHACFDPEQLSAHYPRGARELRPAFHRWQPRDTIEWFNQRGVSIKREPDGRMFPVTDDSGTIIDCLHAAARKGDVRLHKECGLTSLEKTPDGRFLLHFTNGSQASFDKVCITAGSLKDSSLVSALEKLGHSIEPLAPSLFAFNVKDPRIHGLAGLSVKNGTVRVLPDAACQKGPILITHRGLSGPGILRTSAWEARRLQKQNYDFAIEINWTDQKKEVCRDAFRELRNKEPRKAVKNTPLEGIPRRLWESLVAAAGIDATVPWGQLPKKAQSALLNECTAGQYFVSGKTTNKEEFVTAGGIRLKEVDFRRMESRIVPGLHFAGECLDIDGITGGFNFQAAWTAGRIAGLAMVH